MKRPWGWGFAGAMLCTSMLRAGPAWAQDGSDMVFSTDGGRIRGTIMVDDPKEVRIHLADGTTKVIPRAQVKSVQYGQPAAANGAAGVAPTSGSPAAASPTGPAPVAASASSSTTLPSTTTPAARPGTTSAAVSGEPASALAPVRSGADGGVGNDDEASDPHARHITSYRMKNKGMVIGGAVTAAVGYGAAIAGGATLGIYLANGQQDKNLAPASALLIGGGMAVGVVGTVLMVMGRRRVAVYAMPKAGTATIHPSPTGVLIDF